MIKLNPYDKTILFLAILKIIRNQKHKIVTQPLFHQSVLEYSGFDWLDEDEDYEEDEDSEEFGEKFKNTLPLFMSSYLFQNIEFNRNNVGDFSILNNKIINYCISLFEETPEQKKFLKEIGFDKYKGFTKDEVLMPNENSNLFLSDLKKNREKIDFKFQLTEEDVKEFTYFALKLLKIKKRVYNTLFENFASLIVIMKKFYRNNNRMQKFIQVFITDLFFNVDFINSSYKLMLPAEYHAQFSILHTVNVSNLRSVLEDIYFKEDLIYKKIKSIDL